MQDSYRFSDPLTCIWETVDPVIVSEPQSDVSTLEELSIPYTWEKFCISILPSLLLMLHGVFHIYLLMFHVKKNFF